MSATPTKTIQATTQQTVYFKNFIRDSISLLIRKGITRMMQIKEAYCSEQVPRLIFSLGAWYEGDMDSTMLEVTEKKFSTINMKQQMLTKKMSRKFTMLLNLAHLGPRILLICCVKSTSSGRLCTTSSLQVTYWKAPMTSRISKDPNIPSFTNSTGQIMMLDPIIVFARLVTTLREDYLGCSRIDSLSSFIWFCFSWNEEEVPSSTSICAIRILIQDDYSPIFILKICLSKQSFYCKEDGTNINKNQFYQTLILISFINSKCSSRIFLQLTSTAHICIRHPCTPQTGRGSSSSQTSQGWRNKYKSFYHFYASECSAFSNCSGGTSLTLADGGSAPGFQNVPYIIRFIVSFRRDVRDLRRNRSAFCQNLFFFMYFSSFFIQISNFLKVPENPVYKLLNQSRTSPYIERLPISFA